MNPFLIVGGGALLLALFLLIASIMLWQQAKARGYEEGPVYIVEDAISFAYERLTEDVRSRLSRRDVRRIFEWEVYYLQGLADRKATDLEVVAGGADQAIAYIGSQIEAKHGAIHSEDDIRSVLELEALYLDSIGAVGERIGEVIK